MRAGQSDCLAKSRCFGLSGRCKERERQHKTKTGQKSERSSVLPRGGAARHPTGPAGLEPSAAPTRRHTPRTQTCNLSRDWRSPPTHEHDDDSDTAIGKSNHPEGLGDRFPHNAERRRGSMVRRQLSASRSVPCVLRSFFDLSSPPPLNHSSWIRARSRPRDARSTARRGRLCVDATIQCHLRPNAERHADA